MLVNKIRKIDTTDKYIAMAQVLVHILENYLHDNGGVKMCYDTWNDYW
jgi:hypothetical protein